MQGIKRFRSQFNGKLWVEVFLVMGINSMPSVVEKISAAIKKVKPDRIHINTATRPPAEDFVAALPVERMKELIHLFDPPAEIIPECNINSAREIQTNEDSILAMLQRRPSTMKQIEQTFGVHINEVSKYLGNLLRNDYIRVQCKNAEIYYLAVTREQTNNSGT
jgi:wyosine [tRNA(Phe)-imidazoG37] synthetase (radical SAM superfamily)